MLDHSCTSQVATPAQGTAELTECATSIGSVGTGTNELTAANLNPTAQVVRCRFASAIADTFKLSHGGSGNSRTEPSELAERGAGAWVLCVGQLLGVREVGPKPLLAPNNCE